MITDPYQPDAARLIQGSHRQLVRCYAYTAGTGDPIPLRSVGGTVTMAEDWSPYIKANLTIPAPDVDLDGRRADGVRIDAGYVYPGGLEDVHQLAYGIVRTADRDQPGDTLVLEAWSAEGRAQDAKWLGTPQTKNFAGLREALEWITAYALGEPATVDPALPFEWQRDLVSALVLTPGVSMWDLLAELALRAGSRIYCDHLNVWRIEPKVTIASTSAAYLRTGADGTVDRSSRRVDVDPWYDAAVLKYTWDNAAGDEQTVYGRWAPELAADGAGCRTFTQERTGPIAQAAADEAARLTVRNLSTRGDSYSIDSVIMWWLRPGHTVQISLADGTDVRHIVQRVVFNLDTGKMTVTTREPSNLGDDPA